MKALLQFSLFLLTLSVFVITACSKDEEEDMVTEDLTVQVVGNYSGTYKSGRPGFTVSTDNVETEITKVSDSQISVAITTLPGFAPTRFSATMDSDSTFTVPDFAPFDVTFNGSGALNGNTLTIDLEATDSDEEMSYEGRKR